MRDDIFVYISGPMTPRNGFTEKQNCDEAMLVFERLLDLGIPAFAPQAFIDVSLSYETMMTYDLAVINRCTHMLMMPRWKTSPGANRERIHAMNLPIPVYESIEDLQKSISLYRL